MSARSHIREALATRLAGLQTTGARVFTSRIRPLRDDELPAIVISTLGESFDLTYLKNGRPVQRSLRVLLEIVVKANTGFEDIADSALEEIETALFDTHGNNTLGGIVHFIQLASIEDPEMDGSLEKPVVRLSVILRVDYS